MDPHCHVLTNIHIIYAPFSVDSLISSRLDSSQSLDSDHIVIVHRSIFSMSFYVQNGFMLNLAEYWHILVVVLSHHVLSVHLYIIRRVCGTILRQLSYSLSAPLYICAEPIYSPKKLSC